MTALEDLPDSDGIFFMNGETSLAAVVDGLSNTVLIGESLPDQDWFDTD